MDTDMDISMFFEHEIKIKMLHFQTDSYPTHFATDNYLVKYRKNFDRLMEIWQGQSGRMADVQINLNIVTVDDSSIVDHLNEMINFLSNVEMTPELSNIREEMIGDIQQLKYLISFD